MINMAALLTCAFLLLVSRVSQQAAVVDRNSQPQPVPTPAPTLAPQLKPNMDDSLLLSGGMSYLIGGHGRLLVAQPLETSPPHTALFGAQAGGQARPQAPLPIPTAQPTAGPTAAPRLPTTVRNPASTPPAALGSSGSLSGPQQGFLWHFMPTPVPAGVWPSYPTGVANTPGPVLPGTTPFSPLGSGVHTFQVMASFPCTSARTAARVELSARDLYGVLGTPDLHLAAADADEAGDFPNLLPLGGSPANVMKKADIVRELQKMSAAPSPAGTRPSARDSASTLGVVSPKPRPSAVEGVVSPRPRPNALMGVVNASHASPLHRRTRQAESGVSTGVEYCEQQGQDGGTNFLTLCTSCAHTTDLGPDRFPRYVNEVVCGTNSCIFHRNQPMGRCKQRVLYVKMLRRRQGWCMTVQSGSQTVQSDFWETYDQPVRIACDCMILRDSAFASFVKMRR